MRDTTRAGAFDIARTAQDELLPGRKGKGGKGSLPSPGAQLARVSARTPEVMVKITGSAKGPKGTGAHLSYIAREGKETAINENGEHIEGKEAIGAVADEWLESRPINKNGRRAPDTRNLVLSMPEGTDSGSVLRAALTFADREFGDNHQYLAVLHTDEKHPHVHLTVKTRGYDGQNLNPKKADLQRYREGFAHELRGLDVAAEATPRQTRGVVRKADRQTLRHMRQRGEVPRVDQARMKAAAQRREAHPAEQAALERQARVRRAWGSVAKTLSRAQDPSTQKLAGQVASFVKDMPEAKTERQLMSETIKQQSLDRGAGQDKDSGRH